MDPRNSDNNTPTPSETPTTSEPTKIPVVNQQVSALEAEEASSLHEPLATPPPSPSISNEEPSLTPSVEEPQPPVVQPQEPLSQMPVAAEMPVATAFVTSPKKKRKGLVIGIIVGAILLLGGLVAGYLLWYQNPDKVVTDSIVNAIRAKSLTYSGSYEIKGDMKAKLELTGANKERTSDLNAKVTFTFDDKEYMIEASARFDSKGDLYFKVKNIDAFVSSYRANVPKDTLELFDKFVAKINDRWIKVSAEDLGGLNEEASKQQKCVTEAFDKYYKDETAIKEVADVYSKNRFIKITENLGYQDYSTGYVITVDKQAAKNFVIGLKDTKVYKSLNECDPTFKIDEEQFAKDSEATDENNESRVELWVNMWTHDMTKLYANAKQKDSDNAATLILQPKFNQNVDIQAPEGAVSLKELQAELEELFAASVTAGPTNGGRT